MKTINQLVREASDVWSSTFGQQSSGSIESSPAKNSTMNCERVPFPLSHLKEKIFELREYWTPRLNDLPFWTLGRASYKDYHLHNYATLAYDMNEILREQFKDFYKDQLQFFADKLKAPCKYRDDISLPGFHIFQSHPAFLNPMARAHVDVPFNNFKWGRDMTMDSVFTHVGAVQMPRAGGCMRAWWDVGVKELADYGLEYCLKEIEKTPGEEVEHVVDTMIIHSGAFFHRVDPFREHEPDGWRITLQSHAIKLDGVWYLYW